MTIMFYGAIQRVYTAELLVVEYCFVINNTRPISVILIVHRRQNNKTWEELLEEACSYACLSCVQGEING